MYSYRCDICGAYLDPGEQRHPCDDCRRAAEFKLARMKKMDVGMITSDGERYEMILENGLVAIRSKVGR